MEKQNLNGKRTTEYIVRFFEARKEGASFKTSEIKDGVFRLADRDKLPTASLISVSSLVRKLSQSQPFTKKKYGIIIEKKDKDTLKRGRYFYQRVGIPNAEGAPGEFDRLVSEIETRLARLKEIHGKDVAAVSAKVEQLKIGGTGEIHPCENFELKPQ